MQCMAAIGGCPTCRRRSVYSLHYNTTVVTPRTRSSAKTVLCTDTIHPVRPVVTTCWAHQPVSSTVNAVASLEVTLGTKKMKLCSYLNPLKSFVTNYTYGTLSASGDNISLSFTNNRTMARWNKGCEFSYLTWTVSVQSLSPYHNN